MNNLTRWQRPELTTWPTFGRLSGLRDELDRLFEGTFGELRPGQQLLGGWNPPVDVYEDHDNVIVKAEIPGLKREEIEVSLHEGNLIISGERKSERKTEEDGSYRTERFFGRFHRTVGLPTTVDDKKIKAQYRDGILTVTLPKAEEAKPRKIEVNVN